MTLVSISQPENTYILESNLFVIKKKNLTTDSLIENHRCEH